MKLVRAFFGLLIMPLRTRFFYPKRIFKGKRIAIVGPADSAYKSKNGKRIDEYDYVVRVNKALVTWNKQNEEYIGTKTDILVRNFLENLDTGGAGPLDFDLFESFGVKYLVQPRFDGDGLRSMFNYFKKYLNAKQTVYIFPALYYSRITRMFGNYHPTKGFCSLYAALTSPCSEILITGFTFFKTPYIEGYRDQVKDIESNKKHILNQGLHDIDMEYKNFLKLLESSNVKKIKVDQALFDIILQDRNDLVKKISTIG